MRVNKNESKVNLIAFLAVSVLALLAYVSPYWVLVALTVFLTYQKFAYFDGYVRAILEVDDPFPEARNLDKVRRLIITHAGIDLLKTFALLWALYFLERRPLTYLGFTIDRTNILDPLTTLVFTVRFLVLWDQVRDMHWLLVLTHHQLALRVKEPLLVCLFRKLFRKVRGEDHDVNQRFTSDQ